MKCICFLTFLPVCANIGENNFMSINLTSSIGTAVHISAYFADEQSLKWVLSPFLSFWAQYTAIFANLKFWTNTLVVVSCLIWAVSCSTVAHRFPPKSRWSFLFFIYDSWTTKDSPSLIFIVPFCYAEYVFTTAAREPFTNSTVSKLFANIGPKANNHSYL